MDILLKAAEKAVRGPRIRGPYSIFENHSRSFPRFEQIQSRRDTK